MKQTFRFIDKDRLNSSQQLIFLDYLGQSLKNGFSLNQTLELLPHIWEDSKSSIKNMSLDLENGKKFGNLLVELGFSKNIATQLSMALLQGSLIECLEQLTELMRLKNKQIKKLKSELAYPLMLVIMMVVLLIGMQTFLKTEINNEDWTSDVIFIFLVASVCVVLIVVAQLFFLIQKQDYHALSKLTSFPIIGSTIKTYVQYLVVYDLAILLSNGFSLRQICELTKHEEKGSLQYELAEKVSQKLEEGKELKKIIEEEKFLPNNLGLLTLTGANRIEVSQRCKLFGKTLFYELTLKLNKLVINVQPICFLFIGSCVLGMYLKILMPMYNLMHSI